MSSPFRGRICLLEMTLNTTDTSEWFRKQQTYFLICWFHCHDQAVWERDPRSFFSSGQTEEEKVLPVWVSTSRWDVWVLISSKFNILSFEMRRSDLETMFLGRDKRRVEFLARLMRAPQGWPMPIVEGLCNASQSAHLTWLGPGQAWLTYWVKARLGNSGMSFNTR